MVFRDEQDADMACGDSQPCIKPFKTQSLKIEQLFDRNCRLLLDVKYKRVDVKYKRGC